MEKCCSADSYGKPNKTVRLLFTGGDGRGTCLKPTFCEHISRSISTEAAAVDFLLVLRKAWKVTWLAWGGSSGVVGDTVCVCWMWDNLSFVKNKWGKLIFGFCKAQGCWKVQWPTTSLMLFLKASLVPFGLNVSYPWWDWHVGDIGHRKEGFPRASRWKD